MPRTLIRSFPVAPPSGYRPSRSLPSGSIVEDLQAALAQSAEWSRWEACDMDLSRRPNERERLSQIAANPKR